MDSVKYIRVYADSDGESHFQEADVALRALDYAPPAPALFMSAFLKSGKMAFNSLPRTWFGDWHPTPVRQFYITFAGEGEIGTSDGELRRFGPGSIMLLDDTIGKGHRTRVVVTEDWTGVFIQLAE